MAETHPPSTSYPHISGPSVVVRRGGVSLRQRIHFLKITTCTLSFSCVRRLSTVLDVNMFLYFLKLVLVAPAVLAALYAGLLAALANPSVQTHAVYLHAFQLTGDKDLNTPEMFGFLRGQVTPFIIHSADGTPLHSWHILPMGLHRRHMAELMEQPTGLIADVTTGLGFQHLRDDPDAVLAIHFHGAGGNMGSGYRIPNYRALAAGNPDKIHVLTFDYRGFGKTPGIPTEQGLIQDAIAVVDWALNVANIPPSRILIFGQSLGTAVNMAVAEHFASREKPVVFAGHILIAPFVDVPTLVATYKIAGKIPMLSPVARYTRLFNLLSSQIRETWSTKTRIAAYVRRSEATSHDYRITLIHAEDDSSIPWHHTSILFWNAANATSAEGIGAAGMSAWRLDESQDIGAAGSVAHWHTEHGRISEYIVKYGLHDVIMGSPIVSLATMRIFDEDR
jgi:abhydrolase domain-containing protein 12